MEHTSTISFMHIRDLDLNLLHVFQAVHAARNVSRAALSLGLSQPAVSHALTRLRLALRDPLFVRTGAGVAPTAKADHLARQVESALRLLDVALHESEHFDPARSQRRFTVHMSDIGADEFLPLIMAKVGHAAPGVRMETLQLEPQAIASALDEGRIDLAFGYLPDLTGTEKQALLHERYVVVLRRGHPLARELRDRAALERLDFILVRSHAEPARALHLLGLESRIRLTLPHFMVAPSILASTDLAVVVPRRPALRFAERHALQVVEPDLGLPPFEVAMHWTWRVHNDPGHRWLRGIAAGMQFEELGGRAVKPKSKSSFRPSRPKAASAPASTASRIRARSGR
jgi:DNA-binding transcriptional LysR family regulator